MQLAGDLIDVMRLQAGHSRTVEGEGTTSGGIDVDRSNRVKACAFEAEIEPSDAGEYRQAQDSAPGDVSLPVSCHALLLHASSCA